MKELYYIRGIEDRGPEVIKKLLSYYPNAINKYNYSGDNIDNYYFVITAVDGTSIIDYEEINKTSSIFRIIRDYGTELHLDYPKYDFKPFDKVLVKNYVCDTWNISLFSNYSSDNVYPYNTISGEYKRCIPFNEETKHLVGTDKNN